jgi:hypothetical protein
MREHILAEKRVLGLIHLKSGDHLGIRQHELEKAGIGCKCA